MKKLTLVLTAVLALAANTVYAHPDHDDLPPEQVLKLEFAKTRDGAIVYVTNHGEKISTVGASGTLTLVSGQKTTEIALKPADVNGMATAKPTTIAAGTKARATVTTAEKSTVSSEFLVK